MPKGKEAKDLKDVVDTSTETADTPTEATDTSTTAEPITYSQEKHDALKKEALDEQYEKLNKRLTRQGEELARLRQPTQQPPDDAMGTILEELEKSAMYSDDPTAQARLRTVKEDFARKRQIQQAETFANQEREKLNQKIITAGFDPTDEQFDTVWDAFEVAYVRDGKFEERAGTRLDRILSKVTKPTSLESTEKKETEDERIERLSDEKLHKKMEEAGMLVSETGGPSASADSFQAFEEKYNKGLISHEQYQERARKEGKL